MKLFLCPLLFCAAVMASDNPMLKQVRTVYILPMGSGMDQYLANKISRQSLFQVVTDPQRADAILTDRIGEGFEQKLDELYPPPPAASKPDMPKKTDDATAAAPSAKLMGSSKDDTDTGAPAHMVSTFSRGKGTFFLVDRKTRAVIWSTYDRAHNSQADTLDKKADQIVARLKKDMSPKEAK